MGEVIAKLLKMLGGDQAGKGALFGVVLSILVALMLLWGGAGWKDAREARHEADRLAEEAALREAKLLVATSEAAEALQKLEATLAAEDGLREQVAALKARGPVVVERVIRAGTEPAPVIELGESLDCVLPRKGAVSFKVTVLEYKTAAGNALVAGRVSLTRHEPKPTRKIAEAPFSVRLSSVVATPPAYVHVEPPKWGARGGMSYIDSHASAFVGVDRRVGGPAWFTSAAHVGLDGGFRGVSAGLRWEF